MKSVSTNLAGSGSAPGLAHKPLHLKTLLMVLVMVVANPMGNVLLGKGMKHAGDIAIWPLSGLLHTGLRISAVPWIWLGVGSLLVFFVSYMLVLSWADYTFVQPLSSIGYGMTTLFGALILDEKVSPLRWTGVAIICLGVFIVGRTAPRTTTPAAARQNQLA
jgi:drug/metabolite transporter (DMT)-like permease